MKAGYSLWIKNHNGEKIFGKGPYELLVLVDRLGSLNKAALEMGMSYSKALNIIKKCEQEMECLILQREVGGSRGGGSYLTNEGRDLMDRYKTFREKASLEIEKIYNDIFNS